MPEPLQPKPLPDRRARRRLVHGVEVQPRRAAGEQAVAQKDRRAAEAWAMGARIEAHCAGWSAYASGTDIGKASHGRQKRAIPAIHILNNRAQATASLTSSIAKWVFAYKISHDFPIVEGVEIVILLGQLFLLFEPAFE